MTTRACHFDRHHAFTTAINGEAVSDYGAYQAALVAEADEVPEVPLPGDRYDHLRATASAGGKARQQKGRLDRTRARLHAQGVTVAYSNHAYRKLKPEAREKWDREKHSLPEKLLSIGITTRWDRDADFYWTAEEDMPDHLLRYGTTPERPRQPFIRFHVEGHQRGSENAPEVTDSTAGRIRPKTHLRTSPSWRSWEDGPLPTPKGRIIETA